jgi:hypothetical protein
MTCVGKTNQQMAEYVLSIMQIAQGSETAKMAASFHRQVTERDGSVTVVSENKEDVTVADSQTAHLENASPPGNAAEQTAGSREQQGGSADMRRETDSEL